MKKIISIAIIGLMLSICFNINPVSSNSIESTDTGFTFYVDDDFNETTPGWGASNFSKIQDAIDQADDDDRVFVYNGIYNENLLIEKSIILEGEDRDTTIINGEGGKFALMLYDCDNVSVKSFTIKNAINEGIIVTGEENIISNNIISDNKIGIIIYGKNINIIDNVIKNNIGSGIEIHHHYSNIELNNIYNNSYGIFIRDDDNLIHKNEIYNNNKGLYIQQMDNNNINHNNIFDNYYGIYTDKPTAEYPTSAINQIKNNNFIGNNKNLYRYKNDQFDCNYWDDWSGFFWYRIPGAPLIINFPLIGFYFNFDKHPARQPYDINLN